MKCATTQEQLLQCEEPGRPGAVLARHLAQCPACRAFQRQLLEMEDGVRGLEAPPSVLRDRLLARLQEGELPAPGTVNPRPSPWRPTLKERAKQKLALAVALAATLFLFALGWGLWPHATRSTPEIDVVRTNVLRTPSRVDRVHLLATAVRRLQRDVLTASPQTPRDRSEERASIFVEFLEEDLPRRAAELTAAERAAVLPEVLEQLRRSESDLGRACAEQHNPPELCRMARAARVCHSRLRQLLS